MERYVIRQSLYDSWRWYQKLEDRTTEDFLKTLQNAQDAPNEAMQKGVALEADVLTCTQGFTPAEGAPEYLECVAQVADIVKGGAWQVKLSKEIMLDGVPYLLQGTADVVKRDWIHDIKYAGNYELGKYLGKIQHLVYMFITGIEKFAYLVVEEGTYNTWNFYREDYFWQPDSEALLMAELREMMAFVMGVPEFKAAYLEHWKAR